MKRNPNEQERWAYIAGIVDGEGTISIRKNIRISGNTYYHSFVQITNTNEEIINWISENFGGCSRYVDSRKPKWKGLYIWCLHSEEKVEAFVVGVYPYLIIKKKQAQTVMNFLTRDYLNTGESFYHQSIELNKRGSPNGFSEDVGTPEIDTS